MEEQRRVEYPTGLGTSDADHIRLLGHDLAGELIGKVGFDQLALSPGLSAFTCNLAAKPSQIHIVGWRSGRLQVE